MVQALRGRVPDPPFRGSAATSGNFIRQRIGRMIPPVMMASRYCRGATTASLVPADLQRPLEDEPHATDAAMTASPKCPSRRTTEAKHSSEDRDGSCYERAQAGGGAQLHAGPVEKKVVAADGQDCWECISAPST